MNYERWAKVAVTICVMLTFTLAYQFLLDHSGVAGTIAGISAHIIFFVVCFGLGCLTLRILWRGSC